SLIVVERGARAAVVETYAGLGDGVYWSNAVTEVVVGEAARVELYRVQREGPQGLQVATTHSRQERDSFLGAHVVTLGAALARRCPQHPHVRLWGRDPRPHAAPRRA